MKHLRMLKAAGLVTSRKKGRERLHYLNAVPIQMVYDRWVSKYSRGWARSLTELKYDMEAMIMAESGQPDTTKHVFEIYINTTAEKLWEALTNGSHTEKYYFGTRVESEWKSGSEYSYRSPEGEPMIVGRVIEIDPPRRLVMTFNPKWSPDGKADCPESRVTFEINPAGNACKLSLVHDELVAGHPLTEEFFKGWSQILSGLKSVLETGKPLALAASQE